MLAFQLLFQVALLDQESIHVLSVFKVFSSTDLFVHQ